MLRLLQTKTAKGEACAAQSHLSEVSESFSKNKICFQYSAKIMTPFLCFWAICFGSSTSSITGNYLFL